MAKYDSPYSGSGSLTREQFLFYETKVVARLMADEGLQLSKTIAYPIGIIFAIIIVIIYIFKYRKK